MNVNRLSSAEFLKKMADEILQGFHLTNHDLARQWHNAPHYTLFDETANHFVEILEILLLFKKKAI